MSKFNLHKTTYKPFALYYFFINDSLIFMEAFLSRNEITNRLFSVFTLSEKRMIYSSFSQFDNTVGKSPTRKRIKNELTTTDQDNTSFHAKFFLLNSTSFCNLIYRLLDLYSIHTRMFD